MPDQLDRPLDPTRTAQELISFLDLEETDIQSKIHSSGLLEDSSEYAARELPFGDITFIAFRNGAKVVKIFVAHEWLNDMEVFRAGQKLSWGDQLQQQVSG